MVRILNLDREYNIINKASLPQQLPLLSYIMTNHCLNHQYSLLSQIFNKLINIDGFFCLDPPQHCIECDEGACPPNTSEPGGWPSCNKNVSFLLVWWSWPWRWHWQGLHDLAMQGNGTMWPEVEAYLARHSIERERGGNVNLTIDMQVYEGADPMFKPGFNNSKSNEYSPYYP